MSGECCDTQTAVVKCTPGIKPSLYLPETDSGALLPSLSLPPTPRIPHPPFFASTSRTLHNTKVTGSPESILSKTLQTCSVLMCLVFLMTRYVSLIKGSSAEDSRGEEKSTITHAHTHTHTHVHRVHRRAHAHFELFARTPVRLKKRATQSVPLSVSFFFFFFFIPQA